MQKIYPFKFLDSYQREDKDFFFGRKNEIDSLYKMIFQTRILVVFGTSGTGKTSLIRCGLANKFQTYDWLELYIRRGGNLISSLDKALCVESDGAFTYIEQKEPVIQDLTAKLKAVYDAYFKPVYLIFDQFEELYVLGTKKEQEQFIKIIKEILAVEQPVRIILSMREEYLGYLYEFEKEVPQLLRKKLRVESMNLDKVNDVTKGINAYNDSLVKIKPDEIVEFTKEIFERLKGKEKRQTIELPYLQVFLDKLYINKTDDKEHKTEALLSLEDLKDIGDIHDVLQDFLEEQVKSISEELSSDKKVEPENLWKILSKFCTLEGTKEPVSKKELINKLKHEIDQKLIEDAVIAFEKKRIVNKSEDNDLYELAHDSLALKIKEKRTEDEIALLEIKKIIESKAVLKELFNEEQLNLIEPYYDKIVSELTEDEKKLYEDSIKTRNRKRARAKVIMALLFSVILVCLIWIIYLLDVNSMKNKFRSDVKPIEKFLESAKSKFDHASLNLFLDPTHALKLNQEALSFLDSARRKDTFRDKSYRFISTYKKNEYFRIDTIYCSTDSLIKAQARSIIGQNDAFYKIVKPKNQDNLTDTILNKFAFNRIFPDSKTDSLFKVWHAEKHITDTLDDIKDHGTLSQLVFPTDTNRVMVLYKNGTAGYLDSLGRYRPVFLDSLGYFPSIYMDSLGYYPPVKDARLPVLDSSIITSIAPVYYNVIGFKMLSALDNNRLVEWNLNGSIRRSPTPEGIYKPVIYYMKNIHLKDSVVSIAITKDRTKIFTASNKGIGIIWQADTSRVVLDTIDYKVFSLKQDTIISSAFSNNGLMIITGSKDNTVKIWNAENGDFIKELKGHTGPVTSVAFSAKDHFVYTGSLGQTFRQWPLPVTDSISEMSTLQWIKLDSSFIRKITDFEPCDSLKYKIANKISKED